MAFGDRLFVERLFIQSGYVLDFTNQTFRQFFRDDVDVDIDDPKYEKLGSSKGNRLRTFLEMEDGDTVARALRALWEYRKMTSADTTDPKDESRLMALVAKLSPTGVEAATPTPVVTSSARPTLSVDLQNESVAVVTAFASYAQSDPGHKQRVLEAVQQLRRDGIDCYSDHFEPFPKEGWPEWMRRQLRARWVLVFASEAYKRRAEGEEEPGRGLGVIWEHGEIRRELYAGGRINDRFVPVGFGGDRSFVPSILSEYTYFNLDAPDDYRSLLALLKGQPLHSPEPLGGAYGGSTSGQNAQVPPVPPMPVNAAPAASSASPERVGVLSSTEFFSDRFRQAFPGVRGKATFCQPDANKRLSILLNAPLRVLLDDGIAEPIWIWRRGDLGVYRFELCSDGTALLNVEELDIEEVTAVNPGSSYRQFVYVQTRASAPTGLYDSDITDIVALRGDAAEEVGLYKGRYITRAEYDDGAAVIDGEPVDVRGAAELRVRYITPSNFVLAAQGAPINNTKFDRRRQELLNGILRGTQTVDELAAALYALPRRDPLRYE